MRTARDASRPIRRDIVRLAHAGLDTPTVRSETVPLLRRILPFDAIWWAVADPETLLFSQAFADGVPPAAGPLFLENELLHDDVNKFVTLARAPDPTSTLYAVTGGRPEASRRFREIIRPHRMGDELRIALRDGRHTWGFMCLHRDAGAPPFSGQERTSIRQLGPHLAAALRQSLLLSDAASGGSGAPGVLIITPTLELLSVSASATALLSGVDEWLRSGVRAVFIGALTSQLLALERKAAPDSIAPRVRVQTRTGGWLTLSASRLPSSSSADQIVVVIEFTRDEEMIPLLLATYALTAAEERVVRGVLAGGSSKEIAQALGITPLTVQQHLKRIFEKVNVHSRGELRSRLQAQRYRMPRR